MKRLLLVFVACFGFLFAQEKLSDLGKDVINQIFETNVKTEDDVIDMSTGLMRDSIKFINNIDECERSTSGKCNRFRDRLRKTMISILKNRIHVNKRKLDNIGSDNGELFLETVASVNAYLENKILNEWGYSKSLFDKYTKNFNDDYRMSITMFYLISEYKKLYGSLAI